MSDDKPLAYIFGNGPAGLMAAHAAEQQGYRVEIGSLQDSPSHITGAQYLDRAIPGLTTSVEDGLVTFYKRGKATGYAEKIYGDPDAITSWSKYEDERTYPLWYLRDVYSKLWERFKGNMFLLGLNTNVLSSFCDTQAKLIVVTVPRTAICFNDNHKFLSQQVTIYDGLPVDIGKRYSHLHEQPDVNFIMYNGRKKDPWYRCSRINQGCSYEVPGHYEDGHQIFKPISTTCDCWGRQANEQGGPRIVLAGRYGGWHKNWLVSHVYEAVVGRAM